MAEANSNRLFPTKLTLGMSIAGEKKSGLRRSAAASAACDCPSGLGSTEPHAERIAKRSSGLAIKRHMRTNVTRAAQVRQISFRIGAERCFCAARVNSFFVRAKNKSVAADVEQRSFDLIHAQDFPEREVQRRMTAGTKIAPSSPAELLGDAHPLLEQLGSPDELAMTRSVADAIQFR